MQIRTKPVSVNCQAFSLVEVLVAMAVAAVLFVGFYSSVSFGFRTVHSSREDLRATQILIEKLEAIRLCNWQQLTNPSYIPTTFTNYYYPDGTNRSGAVYYGEVILTNVPLTASYATNDMTNVIIRVHWTNGTVPLNREMSTYLARYGLQRYIYGRQ